MGRNFSDNFFWKLKSCEWREKNWPLHICVILVSKSIIRHLGKSRQNDIRGCAIFHAQKHASKGCDRERSMRTSMGKLRVEPDVSMMVGFCFTHSAVPSRVEYTSCAVQYVMVLILMEPTKIMCSIICVFAYLES